MHIEKIILENFKAFEKLEYQCNSKFNIVVGQNNIGKTTIFEALNLWKTVYDKLVQEKNKKKFYKAANNYYLSFNEIGLVRLVDDNDIFFNHKVNSLSITVVIKDGNDRFSLKVKLEKPGIKNSYFRLSNSDGFGEYERFARHLETKRCSLKNAIFIYQTKPISTISKNEPFYNPAQIEKKISIGKSHDVLRNKVLKTENSQVRVAERFRSLEGRLERVLQQRHLIRFKNSNRLDDEYIRITVEVNPGKELELSMMGSGFLQVVEIFSTIEYIEANTDGICLIFIDEPDSHIHSDLQSHLIDELRNTMDSQIFIITHNDRLVKKANEGELFYLNPTVKARGLLEALKIGNFSQVKEGLSSVLSSLEEADNVPLVITEGKTDQKILSTAWIKLFPDQDPPFKLISSGIHIDENSRTGNADSVRRTIEYISTLTERTMVGVFDNDREGREQFKGLSPIIFEPYVANSNTRKHIAKNIYGLCLPVPEHRERFITQNSVTQRYFVIEHYFTDQVLSDHNMKGEPILGTDVFEISGNKNTFADSCDQLNVTEFEKFRVLFTQLIAISCQN